MKKKISFHTEKELEGYKWLAKVIDFGVSLTCNAAINELYTAHAMLRDSDLYRHHIKKLANTAVQQAQEKKRSMFSSMTNAKFFDTYSDKVIDLAESDITMFRISIKQVLDDNNVKGAELISYLETARALLDAARLHFNDVVRIAGERFGNERVGRMSPMQRIAELQRKWFSHFSEFNLSGAYNAWDKLTTLTYAHQGNIDLNTERTNKLFDRLCDKFVNGDYISQCLDEATKAVPDFIQNDIKVTDNG